MDKTATCSKWRTTMLSQQQLSFYGRRKQPKVQIDFIGREQPGNINSNPKVVLTTKIFTNPSEIDP